MTTQDNGPQPNAFEIEAATKANTTYRTVAWTVKYLQVTLMSIPVGSSVGLETHPETDQFLRIDAGSGLARMGPSKTELADTEVGDGWSIQVPAGTWHDVVNTGDEPLQLYAVYAPSHHASGKVHETAEDAEQDEGPAPASRRSGPSSRTEQGPAQDPPRRPTDPRRRLDP